MRQILTMMLSFMICICSVPIQAANVSDDLRGVWISTIYNLDYPSTKNNVELQKKEFIEKLESIKAMGLNAVFVQVRPKADALYASIINPWSEVLTGTQGKHPGYDPMAFMIEETHKRGMEFHAWLNPYRVTTSGTDLSVLTELHPARKNPSWTFTYNNAIYYNPEVEGVKQHLVDTVKEIVTYYDVDGVHFDDYFYPSNYPLPSGQGKDGAVANARRAAVNDMVKRVGESIKDLNKKHSKKVSFGISPPGIWKNSSSDATGSNTNGRETYYALFADTRTWIKNGWIDYIAPQIYWEIGHSKADYKTLVEWWNKEVSGTGVKLYIGQGIYTDVVAKQIDTQLNLNKQYANVSGSIFFSLRDLLNNRQSCKTKITNFYKGTVSTPNTPNTSIGSTGTANSNASVSDKGKTGTVTTTLLNIREGARTDRKVLAQLKLNEQVLILDVLNGWYKVKLPNGQIGWGISTYIKPGTSAVTTPPASTTPNVPSIPTPNTTPTFPLKGNVNADILNVREGAKTTAPIITKLTKGTEVTAYSELNGWYKLKFQDGTVGWVSKEYITV